MEKLCIKMFTKFDNYFLMFFVVAKLGEISDACNFISTV